MFIDDRGERVIVELTRDEADEIVRDLGATWQIGAPRDLVRQLAALPPLPCPPLCPCLDCVARRADEEE